MVRWIDNENVTHIHNGILFSHKKNKIMPFAATWMDLEIVIISEVSQTKKDKYHMILLIGGIFKERVQMNLFTKQSHRCRKQNYGYQGVRWGRDKLGEWDWYIHITVYKIDN